MFKRKSFLTDVIEEVGVVEQTAVPPKNYTPHPLATEISAMVNNLEWLHNILYGSQPHIIEKRLDESETWQSVRHELTTLKSPSTISLPFCIE